MERLADQYDLRRDIRFETEVTAARYDEAMACYEKALRTQVKNPA